MRQQRRRSEHTELLKAAGEMFYYVGVSRSSCGGMVGEEAGEMGGAASLSHRLGKCSNFYLMKSSSVLTFASRAVFA